jgi:hypothetical protein
MSSVLSVKHSHHVSKNRRALLGIPFLLLGCAASSGVFKVAPDTYQTNSSAITSFGGSATANNSAMKKATATCAKMGKEVQVVNQQNDAQFTGASVNITFKCVDPAPTPPG